MSTDTFHVHVVNSCDRMRLLQGHLGFRQVGARGAIPAARGHQRLHRVRFHRTLSELRLRGRREGIPSSDVYRILRLARRAHHLLLAAAHYEELRAILASWRFLHRWLALLLVVLTTLHVYTALRYASPDWSVFGLDGHAVETGR